MAFGGDAVSRVNDGSDFQYRMSVDDRYKQAAQHRTNLTSLTSAQCFYSLISGLLSAALLGRPEAHAAHETEGQQHWWETYTTASAHVHNLSLLEAVPLYVILISAVAGFVGLFAVKGNKASPLRFQALLSAAAVVLAIWPAVEGAPISSVSSEYKASQVSGDHTWFIITLILSLQHLIGFVVNGAVAVVASSLASTVGSPKKDK